MLKIRSERVYELKVNTGEPRYLVDRLWPRGIRKEDLALTAWLKEIAPSNELRKWFNHEPEKWQEFQKRYLAELDGKDAVFTPVIEAAENGGVLLLYGATNKTHNHTVVLKEHLQSLANSTNE